MADFDLIRAEGKAIREEAFGERLRRVRPFARRPKEFAEKYVATQELRTAANVALSLGRPLLLTGEPGSGKTLAAWWIADRLNLEDPVIEFHVKSDSRARDLCYEFDGVSWYRASQLANEEVAKDPFVRTGPLGEAFGWRRDPAPSWPRVVLIDEIDKAPRDFPNDLLLELDQMRFTVHETREEVECPPGLRPIIVITSNAERRLPDPFLRRCIIHRINIAPVVPEILARRLGEFGTPDVNLQFDAALIDAAGKFWNSLESKRLSRKPTIDEFWRWLALALHHGGKPAAEITAALTRQRDGLGRLPFIDTLFASQDLSIVTGDGP
jgi:MoxR-like ATPase